MTANHTALRNSMPTGSHQTYKIMTAIIEALPANPKDERFILERQVRTSLQDYMGSGCITTNELIARQRYHEEVATAHNMSPEARAIQRKVATAIESVVKEITKVEPDAPTESAAPVKRALPPAPSRDIYARINANLTRLRGPSSQRYKEWPSISSLATESGQTTLQFAPLWKALLETAKQTPEDDSGLHSFEFCGRQVQFYEHCYNGNRPNSGASTPNQLNISCPSSPRTRQDQTGLNPYSVSRATPRRSANRGSTITAPPLP